MRFVGKLLFIAIVAFYTCALCVASEKPISIPTYPGGEQTMEVNISNEEITQFISAMLPMAGSAIPNADDLNPLELAEVFKDVKKIEFAEVEVAAQKATLESIATYYQNNIPGRPWRKIFWLNEPSSLIAAYMKPNAKGIYGYVARLKKSGKQNIFKTSILYVDGQIDFAKIISILAQLAETQITEKPAIGETN